MEGVMRVQPNLKKFFKISRWAELTLSRNSQGKSGVTLAILYYGQFKLRMIFGNNPLIVVFYKL